MVEGSEKGVQGPAQRAKPFKLPYQYRILVAFCLLIILPSIYFINLALNTSIQKGFLFWLALSVFALTSIILIYWIERFFKKLHQLSHSFQDLALGNFKVECKVKEDESETGRFMRSFRKIKAFFNKLYGTVSTNFEKISHIAHDLITSSGEVNASTEQISSTVQEIAKGAQRQSKQVNQIADSISEFTEKIKGIAEKMKVISKSTSLADQTAADGNKSAQLANEKILSIKNSVINSSDVVQTLGEKSLEINKIIEVINDISEQTNLLALNANIEAARAGEAGRGFAVVADEVRKLAEQSQKATQQISSLIGDIQDSTKKAVTSMEDGKKQVEEGAEVINNALVSLEGISAEITNINKMIREAEGMTAEQVNIVDNINTSMNEFSAIAEENAAGSEEVSASIEETTSTIQQLANFSTELSNSVEDLTRVLAESGFKLEKNVK